MIYSLEQAIYKARKIVKEKMKTPSKLVKDLLDSRRKEANNE